MTRTTVLVASGDEELRTWVRLVLAGERFDVREAEDTDGAIFELIEDVPGLLVLDAALPGRGALPLARSVRSQPETAGVGTLLVMPHGQGGAADAPGVDGILGVPATALALRRALEDVLTAPR